MKLLPGILIVSASAVEFKRAREIEYEDNSTQGLLDNNSILIRPDTPTLLIRGQLAPDWLN